MASRFFTKQPFNRLYLKNPTGMHWYCSNDATYLLKEEASQVFRPTANFESSVFRLLACLPAPVRPGCARCRTPEISHNKDNGRGFLKNVVPKTIYPLRHGDSLYPSLFFYIPLARCEPH